MYAPICVFYLLRNLLLITDSFYKIISPSLSSLFYLILIPFLLHPIPYCSVYNLLTHKYCCIRECSTPLPYYH